MRLDMELTNHLGQELVALAGNDLAVRETLAADGSLSNHGYHPRMEASRVCKRVSICTPLI